jgi:hypothetical protein
LEMPSQIPPDVCVTTLSTFQSNHADNQN